MLASNPDLEQGFLIQVHNASLNWLPAQAGSHA
jgi:hypothetical protein